MRRLTLPAILAATALLGVSAAHAQDAGVRLETIAQGLDSPVFVTAPAGDPRLFIVEQTGRIRILADGEVRSEPFLDVSDRISTGGERGLLGLAFHPDFAGNGRFFVNYTDADGNTQVVGYTASGDAADPASATPVFSVEQPYGNHNGGWLGFGPDGLLYVGMGDGGAGGDPENRAQNPDELLGKILRVDPDAASAPEVFALGVRNPWRMAFDGDALYVADVGQGAWEEISVITTADAGANLGWNLVEGPECFDGRDCDPASFVAPVHSYSHETGGCSITGGFVYRGAALPQLQGQYFFSDFCDGRIRSIIYADGQAGPEVDWSDALGNPGSVSSFGTDSSGELYLMTIDGNLSKLVPAS
jgi:glucose/arabinose dehydrogenase